MTLLAELQEPRLRPVRPRTTPEALRADKACSARAESPRSSPSPPTSSATAGTRLPRWAPVGFDACDYKNRNVVERAINHFKNWRGLATRYDEHALVYRGGVVLAAILLWLA